MKKYVWLIVSITLVFVLCCSIGTVYFVLKSKQIVGGLKIANPSTIAVYNNSFTPTIYDSESNEYNEIMQIYDESGNSNKWKELSNPTGVSSKIEQQLDENTKWDKKWKSNGILIEFRFTDVQKQIVWKENNSKVIEYFSLAFRVEEIDDIRQIKYFFRTTEGTNTIVDPETYTEVETFNSNPMLAYINTFELYNYLVGLTNAK